MKSYKQAVDTQEARRRREDQMYEVRKNQREENIMKKRKEGMQAQSDVSKTQVATVEKKVRTS